MIPMQQSANPTTKVCARRTPSGTQRTALRALGTIAILSALAVTSGCGTVSGSASAGAASSTTAEEASSSEDTATDDAKIGTAVRDGNFEFTVTKVKDGVKKVGSGDFSEKPDGQFVLVYVTVENIGDEAQYFDGSSQTLVDDQDREHSADTGAAIYLEDADSFLNEINPGNKVKAIVVFDVPKDAVPTSIDLHDSMFSGGVSVALTK